MRILSWNILHGGGSRVPEILESLQGREVDVVFLQEFRRGGEREADFIKHLEAQGLEHFESIETDAAKDNTVAIFSRHPLEQSRPLWPGDPYSLTTRVAAPETPFRILTAHFPQKKAQIPYFEALLDLPKPDWIEQDALIIGDLNCGIPLIDSDTKTFYATHLFQQALRMGWVDAWRSRHPKAREYTWISARSGNGFRYDHALASSSLDKKIRAVQYDHEVREGGVSDHSALLVEW